MIVECPKCHTVISCPICVLGRKLQRNPDWLCQECLAELVRSTRPKRRAKVKR